jgi:hypothetical protein
MKTILAGLVLSISLSAAAADSNWKGWISDEHCGAKGAKAGHEACALKCMGKGSKLVFVNTADSKVYAIDKQDEAKKQLGHEVTLTGTAEGDSIKVASIEAAK